MIQHTFPFRSQAAFAASAALLLAGTLAWHLPLMLWDHIDLVPIYEAWRNGTLASSDLWRVHDGSHLHVAAYTVLLATTWLSDGRPWLDCVASWCLLAIEAWLLMRIVADRLGNAVEGVWWYAFLLLALYPGHLVNLQWGWQIAVFIGLLGAVAPIFLMSSSLLGVRRNAASLLLAILGVLGFTTSLAVFPVAIVLIALRRDVRWSRRVAFALPWALACVALTWWLENGRVGTVAPTPDADKFALYVLNYLGAGVSRFADAMAPAMAAIALSTGALAVARSWGPRQWPWLGLMLFALGCAVLTALGRAAEYGSDHAFATRYVSFSSLFWFGWLGAMLTTWQGDTVTWRWRVRPLLATVLVFALANGLHMIKQAIDVHVRVQSYAASIRDSYPELDDAVMKAAYGWRAPAARERLGVLRDLGYAPFSESHELRGPHLARGLAGQPPVSRSSP